MSKLEGQCPRCLGQIMDGKCIYGCVNDQPPPPADEAKLKGEIINLLYDVCSRVLNKEEGFTLTRATEKILSLIHSDRRRIAENIKLVTDLVNKQAEDEGLWFIAQTAPEAYLQKQLRILHASIECNLIKELEGE